MLGTIGAALGGVGGVVASTDPWVGGSAVGDGIEGALLLGSVGVAVGAGLGALIGTAFSHWSTVYRAPPRRRVSVRFAPAVTPRGTIMQLGASLTL